LKAARVAYSKKMRTTRNPPSLAERIRTLFRKRSIKGVARHLPALLRIFTQGVSGGVPGAVISLIHALVSEVVQARVDGTEATDGRLLSLADKQEELSSRCETLEKENIKLGSEVALLTDQAASLSRDVQGLKNEILNMRRRNAYLVWALMVVFFVACSAFAWNFRH
jgi:hypothetical protein